MAFSMMYGTGFEMGALTVRDTDVSGCQITSASVTGSYGLELRDLGSTPVWIRYHVSGSPSDLYLAVWVDPHRAYNTSDVMVIRFYLDDDSYIDLRWDVPNWDLYHSVNGEIATGSVHVENAWHHVQIHLVIGASGSADTKIDGIDDISFSGDTAPGTGTSIDRIEFRQENFTVYLDDFCFGTGGWPGDIRFEALLPDGDTATIDWTGSDGDQVDNYALIDERPPSDADYVEGTVTGQKDKYTLQDFDATNKSPLAVVLWARAMKDEADAHQLKLILDDGTEDVGAAQDLLTSYTYLHRLDLTKPSGGAWTDAALDALKAAIESVIV